MPLFLLPSAAAAQKTDVLVLLGGDRVTGEIRSYSQGRVNLDTSSAGVIPVKWNHILSISSDKRFDLETITGKHYFGSLAPSDPPGKLVIVQETATLTLDFLDVFQLAPLFQSFWRRWDGSLDAGFNYTQSSQLIQFNLNADSTYRRPKYELVGTLSFLFSHQTGVTETSHGAVAFRYDRFLPNRWLFELGVGLERNVQLGLKLRELAVIGGGRNFIQTNQGQLTGFAGVSVNREEPVEGEGKNNAEAVVGGRYSYFMYDFPKLTLAASVIAFPSITTSGRVRLEASGSAKREIVSDFYVSLSVFDSFDRKDPTTGRARNDWGPTISIGWKF